MTPRAPAMAPEDRRTALVEVTIPLLKEHGVALTTKQVAEEHEFPLLVTMESE